MHMPEVRVALQGRSFTTLAIYNPVNYGRCLLFSGTGTMKPKVEQAHLISSWIVELFSSGAFSASSEQFPTQLSYAIFDRMIHEEPVNRKIITSLSNHPYSVHCIRKFGVHGRPTQSMTLLRVIRVRFQG